MRKLLLMLSTLLVCFAAAHADEVNEDEIRARALDLLGGQATILIVPARGAIADGAFSLKSKAAPSKMAKEISALVAKARQEEVRVAFAGAKSSKTRFVVLQALSITEGDLPGLHATFFGEPDDAAQVQQAVLARKGMYHDEHNPMSRPQ